MKSKKLTILLLVALLAIFSLATSVEALQFTDEKFGNEILYTLNIEETADPYVLGVTFSIQVFGDADVDKDWYVPWIAIKIDGQDATISTDPASYFEVIVNGTDVTDNWINWDIVNDENIWGGKAVTDDPKNLNSYYNVSRPQGGFVGFYLGALDDEWVEGGADPDTAIGNEDLFTNGILVTQGGVDASFSYYLNLTSELTVDDIGALVPFQVGYYDPVPNGNIKTNRLSECLIPEPTTMLLLGSALLGLGILGRRKFKI